jgi:excisionase family DNA binding protein
MPDTDKKYLTQKEVAELFRVSQSTVKNWRDAGLLEYFQPPGSTRVLYPRASIEEFERNYTRRVKKMEVSHAPKAKKEPAVVPSGSKKVWRI